MLKREFRTYTKKENRTEYVSNSKQLKKYKDNPENACSYERLTFSEMQNITSSSFIM